MIPQEVKGSKIMTEQSRGKTVLQSYKPVMRKSPALSLRASRRMWHLIPSQQFQIVSLGSYQRKSASSQVVSTVFVEQLSCTTCKQLRGSHFVDNEHFFHIAISIDAKWSMMLSVR